VGHFPRVGCLHETWSSRFLQAVLGIRKRRGARIALVPNQWDGSVQQYYHFLLGYLAPILLWLDKSGSKQITIRDCGPMNRWVERILHREDVNVMPVGLFLHIFAGKLQPYVVLRGMDFPEEFSSKRLTRFKDLVLERLEIDAPEPTLLSVIDRATTDTFYFTAESEIDLAGAARRSTPNLHAWVESQGAGAHLHYFDPTHLVVDDQVLRFVQTRVLIGQHGAGLTNMVFMRPGGTVVEIQPPLPERAVSTFQDLARACGHEYIRVPQANVHSEINFLALDNVIQNLM